MCTLSNDLLVSGSADKTIRIWSMRERKLIRTILAHGSSVLSVKALRADRLISYSADDTIKIWNPYLSKNAPLISMTGHGNKGYIIPIGILPNEFLVTCSRNDQEDATLRVWNPNTGQLVKIVSTQSKEACSMLVLANGQVAVGFKDGTIRITNFDDLQKSVTFKSGHNCYIWALTQRLDGRMVSAGGSDHSIKVWDLDNRSAIQSISTDHTCLIKTLNISQEGELMTSCSFDTTIKIWHFK